MVRYFVIPQKDEAFYSLLARFKEHLNMATSRLNINLFGYSKISHNILSCNHLTTFCQRLGSDFSISYQQIHDYHTLLPLFKNFNQKFIGLEDKENPMKFVPNQYLFKREFKFCPICFNESYSLLGEPYWNRMHNIPYIQICLIHKVRLQRWFPDATSVSKCDLFPASKIRLHSETKYEKSHFINSLTFQTLECFNGPPLKDLDGISRLAKEVGLLKREGTIYKFNTDHLRAINRLVREATLNSTQDSIDILKSIRLMLFKRAATINPYSYLILLAYINNCPKVKIPPKIKIQEVDQDILHRRRSIWENELNSDHFTSIVVSSKKLKTEYRWLLKKDTKWVVNINKKKRKRTFIRTKQKTVITKTDDQVVLEIKTKINSLIKKKIDRQISKQLIFHLPEFKFLTKNTLEYLPKAKAYIENNLETKFEYRKRAITQFLADNKDNLPSKSKVLEKFRINYRRKYSANQQAELTKIIGEFYSIGSVNLAK